MRTRKICFVLFFVGSISLPLISSAQYGLVPCGTTQNNPETPWDETESCGLKHVILLVKNLLDFVLWKAVPLIIVLLAAATGAILYFSFGGPETIARAKSIWKAVGAGALIILLSWTFVNLLLGLLGYSIDIFGRWEEIKF
ncbi:MAG: hypothetical protein HYW95_02510 [Candidatus Wildermuthbacteria bacterium]|nr:hypothetical protein [Candidatus Wildermuthbacteria bacterium]